MRRCILIPLCLVLAAGCSGQSAKQTASSVTQKAVEVGKGTLSGVEEGIDEGRKSAESSDGAALVTNAKELQEQLSLEVRSVSDSPAAVKVEIVLTNDNERPVRISNLDDQGALLLMDAEGFANRPINSSGQITVPERAKIKHSFAFEKSEASPHLLRLWGQEFPLPKIASLDGPAPDNVP